MSYVTKDTQFTDLPIEDIHRHIVPYQYREYPRHLHKGEGDAYQSRVVNSDEEKAAAIADGFFLDANEAAAAAKSAAPVSDAPSAEQMQARIQELEARLAQQPPSDADAASADGKGGDGKGKAKK